MTRRPERIRKVLLAAAILLVALVPLLTPDAYVHNVLILTFLVAVVASGWNIMAGLTGYISLGHGMFVGVGAYTGGILATTWDVSPFVVAPLGGVTAALVAVVLGLVTRRTRGPAFVIVSFAVLELLGLLTRNWASVTGGSQGLPMPLPTWDVRFHNWPFYYALFALVLLSVGLTVAIRRSKLGLGLLAIKDDEDKAAGIGIVTSVYKGLAFVASAAFVGVAGAVYGYYISSLSVNTMFDVVLSMQVVLAALLGGRGTVWGPVLGAFLVVPLTEVTNTTLGGADAGAIRLILFGGLVLGVALLLPRGILPTVRDALARRRGETGLTGARLEDTPIPDAPPRRRPPVNTPDALRVSGVTMRFGGLAAVDDVTLTVPRHSTTALIGPNGSGKTTLFNVVDGTYAPTSGDVELGGVRITRAGRPRRAFLGLGRTYQLPRLFGGLSVLENVAAACGEFRIGRLARSAISGPEAERALELLEFVGLRRYADAKATELSYGQRKLVELAQVLMLDPDVILLDEPAAGINPTLLRRLSGLIRALTASGRTFVIVEHDMQFVLSLADRAAVLARGRVIATGSPADVSSDHAVLEAYLGDDFVLEADMTGSER
jgi:branched-chain amino acid transport system permease protein